MTIRIVIADDQAMVRAGFAALLDAQPDMEVVGQAADGAQGVELARRTSPDVVLMDVRMPVLNGIEATRELLAAPADPPPRVLMLTTFDIDEYVYDAIRAGASGFLLKDALPGDLIAAVRVIAQGDALLAPSVTRRLIEQFAHSGAPRQTSSAALERLTERERDVLLLVARGRPNHEIATELFIAEQTVKTHVSRILAKLEISNRAQAVVAAYESGLVTPGGSADQPR
ncbi:response regulator [Compostimonas suwonensis]|uniref:DNA-binding NarL/FixJ family response regulator n=1 Tax=Compostimonas suwonensis TaxID=1048394 RepID=A0A2M9BCW8_9MICO|nr:response regulator transcription factor [Compostimonas suwonensis]PJJ55754.1 DNA-binding NarL/FixJ family response regulator [Compostimonas suwonensis]